MINGEIHDNPKATANAMRKDADAIGVVGSLLPEYANDEFIDTTLNDNGDIHVYISGSMFIRHQSGKWSHGDVNITEEKARSEIEKLRLHEIRGLILDEKDAMDDLEVELASVKQRIARLSAMVLEELEA